MQHIGDLTITGDEEISRHRQITGTTYVKSGAVAIIHGQMSGGLIIEEGGRAIVHGQVARNLINQGSLVLFGQVVGRIIGNAPENALGEHQVVGDDLEVPFRGYTSSSSSTTILPD